MHGLIVKNRPLPRGVMTPVIPPGSAVVPIRPNNQYEVGPQHVRKVPPHWRIYRCIMMASIALFVLIATGRPIGGIQEEIE